jgi:hypothetical protein
MSAREISITAKLIERITEIEGSGKSFHFQSQSPSFILKLFHQGEKLGELEVFVCK